MSSSKVEINGSLVTAARALLKMTQADLAAAAGLTEQAVNRFEKGRTVPRATTVEAIRMALENRGIIFSDGDLPGVALDRRRAIIPT